MVEIRGMRGMGHLAAATLILASGMAAGQDHVRSRLVIDVERLVASFDDPNLVLLHVGDAAKYESAHIPGARLIRLDDISTPHPADEEGLMLELPEPSVLREALEGFGISDDSRIVVYFADEWVTASTRVMLTLEHAGLGDRAVLLDGGLEAWKAADRPVTAEPAPVRRGRLGALHTRDVVVTVDEVKARLDRPGTSIVDARAPRFWEGRYESARQRPGRIVGAKSIPFTEIVDETLRLKSTEELRALFRDAGVAPSDTIIAYCHIGQQATTVVFAARLLGHPVKLFDGSYEEWGRRADLPIEKAGGGETATAEPFRGLSPAQPARLSRPLLAPALLTTLPATSESRRTPALER